MLTTRGERKKNQIVLFQNKNADIYPIHNFEELTPNLPEADDRVVLQLGVLGAVGREQQVNTQHFA